MLHLLFVSTAVCLPVLCLALGASPDGFDLAQTALIRVGSVRSPEGNVNDRWEGPLALRDGDPATAWQPAEGAPAELTARVQGVAGDGVTLSRVVLRFLAGPVLPERVEWAGAVLPPEACVVEGDCVACTPPKRTGRWLRMQLPALSPGNGISALEIEALPTVPPAPPALKVEPWRKGLHLSAEPISGTCRLEVERRVKGRPEHRFLLAAGALSGLDRPRPGPVEYAVRGIGFGGTPGPWSAAWRGEFGAFPPPATPVFGVVEGFYGRPWTWEERLSLLQLMAALGMNHYVYAPKDEPLHRDQWRTPYPATELAHFSGLLAAARALSIEASFGISPGLSMAPDSDCDFAALADKLGSIIDLGFPSVTLLLDDIKVAKEPRVGAAHARLTLRLFDHLSARGVKLQFVGTVYAGTASSLADEHRGYLEQFKVLPSEIPVMWTGDAVFDSVMEPQHARGIAAVIGRPPLVWDNFPVNDYAHRSQRLFLGPVTGRTKELLPEIHGLVSNPMTHAAASVFSLVSYGDLLADTEPVPAASPSAVGMIPAENPATVGTIPGKDLAVAFGQLMETASLLEGFARDHFGSVKMLPGKAALPELTELSTRFMAALDREDGAVVGELASRLIAELSRRYVDDLRLLQQAATPSLACDLFAPIEKRRAQVEVALEALSLLASGDRHPWGPCRLHDLVRRYHPAPLDWTWFGLEEAVQPLVDRALRRWPLEKSGPRDSRCAGEPSAPEEAVVAEPFYADFVRRGASYELLGDGVRPTDDGRLVAACPGHHRVVVVTTDGAVVAARGFELFAREATYGSEGGKAGLLDGDPR